MHTAKRVTFQRFQTCTYLWRSVWPRIPIVACPFWSIFVALQERRRGKEKQCLTSSGTNAPKWRVQVASGGSVMIVKALLISGERSRRRGRRGRPRWDNLTRVRSPKKKAREERRRRRQRRSRKASTVKTCSTDQPWGKNRLALWKRLIVVSSSIATSIISATTCCRLVIKLASTPVLE